MAKTRLKKLERYCSSESKSNLNELNKLINIIDEANNKIKTVIPSVIDIEEKIDSIKNQMEFMILEKCPNKKVKIEHCCNLNSDCDVTYRISHILYNIIKNIINKISNNGNILIETKDGADNNVEIFFIVKGYISSIAWDSIFDFSDNDKNRQCGEDGLTFFQQLLKILDGNIRIENENNYDDENLNFYISLPKYSNTLTKEKNINVFISYASENYNTAKKLYDDLKNKGITPWLDKEDLLPGQKWREVIPRIIKDSSYFLLIFSKSSVSKAGYVQKEQKIALDLLDEFPSDKIFIIPVRIDNTEPIDEKLRNLHWADLSDYKNGLEKILKTLGHNSNLINNE